MPASTEFELADIDIDGLDGVAVMGRDRIEQGLVAVPDRDACTALDEASGDGETNALAAARDDGDAVVEVVAVHEFSSVDGSGRPD